MKINSEGFLWFFTKISTPENCWLYGISLNSTGCIDHRKVSQAGHVGRYAYHVVSFDDFSDFDCIEASLIQVVVWILCVIEETGEVTATRGVCEVSQ